MTHNNSTFDLSRQHRQQQKPAQGSSKATGEERKALTTEQRKRLWDATYRTEHPDYKGRLQDGTQTMLGWAAFGGGLVSLASISDAELIERDALSARTSAKN